MMIRVGLDCLHRSSSLRPYEKDAPVLTDLGDHRLSLLKLLHSLKRSLVAAFNLIQLRLQSQLFLLQVTQSLYIWIVLPFEDKLHSYRFTCHEFNMLQLVHEAH